MLRALSTAQPGPSLCRWCASLGATGWTRSYSAQTDDPAVNSTPESPAERPRLQSRDFYYLRLEPCSPSPVECLTLLDLHQLVGSYASSVRTEFDAYFKVRQWWCEYRSPHYLDLALIYFSKRDRCVGPYPFQVHTATQEEFSATFQESDATPNHVSGYVRGRQVLATLAPKKDAECSAAATVTAPALPSTAGAAQVDGSVKELLTQYFSSRYLMSTRRPVNTHVDPAGQVLYVLTFASDQQASQAVLCEHQAALAPGRQVLLRQLY